MDQQAIDAALAHHRTLLDSVETLQAAYQGVSEDKALLEQHKASLEQDVRQLRGKVATLDNTIAKLRPAPDEAESETNFVQYIQATQGAAALADGNWRGLLQSVWQAAVRWDAERRRII